MILHWKLYYNHKKQNVNNVEMLIMKVITIIGEIPPTSRSSIDPLVDP